MELKEFQKKTLAQVEAYLRELASFKEKNDKAVAEFGPEVSFNFPEKAWEKVSRRSYHSTKNGLGEHLSDFFLKIPTGGGKTLFACHVIDQVNRIYLKRQTGVVLWIVPTTQIYRQTLASLKNREHPYRQVLNISSGGKTKILEKTEVFTKQDVKENLVVMLLMLPSANRQTREVLRVFKDSGGFTDFFPAEDDYKGHRELLEQFPNLDCFGNGMGFQGKTIKTSLGNTLRILRPLIILDEGHKAYSQGARDTIRGFNPSVVVELSATPPRNGNILVEITGQELNREEMIKLDMHVAKKASVDWKDAMLAAIEKRNYLETKAVEYESNTGERIRPICLVQVERTGRDQRGLGHIHSEEVKEFLLRRCGIPEEHIAIKSSEKDDIEGIDLLVADCQIRYIITKQALQEGWDCAFAYVLVILTNPHSERSITQLVGRILRQPGARKTKIKELDESYVFFFRASARDILTRIREGFQGEGLGDLTSRITIEEGEQGMIDATRIREIGYREEFRRFEDKIYLPKFVIQEKEGWRDLSYEMDILSRIDWSRMDIAEFTAALMLFGEKDEEILIGLSKDTGELIKEKARVSKGGGFKINRVFMSRQIIDIVRNPWVAFEISKKTISSFVEANKEKTVADNFVFIIEELKKYLEKKRDQLAETVFRKLVKDKELCFFLLCADGGYLLPSRLKVGRAARELDPMIQKSLFDFVPEDQFNQYEREVALYLDEQERLLWWYRNLVGPGYYFIQGWKGHRIYPDFIFTEAADKRKEDYSKVFVVETKGIHLKNEDTEYKQDVFRFCSELGKQIDWSELASEFPEKKIEFHVIFEDEWKRRINEIFNIGD